MFRSLVVATVLVCSLALPLSAQLVNGVVQGTAIDAQGGAIPDVQVTMTNLDTGVTTSAITDPNGRYRFSAVQLGDYSLEFKREGFKSVKVEKMVIVTAKETSADGKLDVGPTATQITVEVPGIELDKSGPNVRFNLYWQVMSDTPMGTTSLVPAGSRNYLRYALMGPAVARVPGQNETSTAGHRGRENNYLADGVENNDNTVTLPGIFIPPEAIGWFQLQIANYSAEFGHSMGSTINVTTKSGSNAFHGEVWDFSRSSALEPLSLQSQKGGLTKTPRLSAHQFGADLGGPIVQNKTFFFGIVQWNLQRQAALTLNGVTIPTPAGYASLLNAPLRPAVGAVPAQSEASRQEILNKLSFLPDFYPEVRNFSLISNTSVNGTPVELGQFIPLIPQNQDIWYVGGRLDHQITEGSLSYRFHMDHRNKPLGASSSNRAFGERWAADDLTFGQTHALSFTKILSSHWVNEARLAYTRLDPSIVERDPVSPTIKISSPAFTIGGSDVFPQERLEQTYQFQNMSSYVWGRHTLKAGLDLARTRMDNNNAPNSKGTWTFSTIETFMNNTPLSLTQLVVANSRYSFNQLRQAYFLQDDIKVTRNFTANLGLRYELQSVPLGFFGATSQQELDAMVPAPVKQDKNNFAPRVGFAYSPEFESGFLGKVFGDRKSSIRGGFGIGYDVLFYNLLTSPAGNYPRNNPTVTTSTQLVDVFPTMLPPQTTAPALTITTAFANLPTDTQRPTSSYWSLSVQRQLRQDYILELGYTANRSYHLLRQNQANPGVLDPAKAAFVRDNCTFATLSSCQEPAGFPLSPFTATSTNSGRQDPRFASRVLLEATGEAEYHAAYIRLEKKFSNGLQFGANYTWSANLSDSEDILIGDQLLVGSSPANPQDFRNRRNEWSRSVLDRPHRFSAQYAYRIPGFATSSSAVLRHALSGWQVSGFTELQSGQPFTIRVGVDAIGNGLSNTSAAVRPNYNPNGIVSEDADTGNLRTFRIPLDGTGIVDAPHVTDPLTGAVTYLRNSMEFGGNLGRNTFRGPGLANTNLSVMKRFSLPKEMQLQIRGDFINVFNHHNFANPDSNMSNPNTFGQQTLAPVMDSRQVLLGAKFLF
jgi:hypothetical protein